MNANPSIQTPRDLLSVIPLAIGYQPEESLAVVSIRNNATLGLIVRVSLADLAGSGASKYAQLITQHALSDDAGQVFLIWYTEIPYENDHLVKLTQLFQAELLAGQLESQVWQVNEAGFRHLECEYGDCCPESGFSTQSLQDTAIRAELVYRGYSAAASRDSYLAIPSATDIAKRLADQGANSFQAKRAQLTGQSWRQQAFNAWLACCEQARRNRVIAPEQFGVLRVALADAMVRDAVLVACIPDGLQVASEMINDQRRVAREARDLLEPIVRSDAAQAPCPDFNRIAARILNAVVAHSDDTGRVAPLTLLAFLSWWQGDGTRANQRLAEASAISPHDRLAKLLAHAQQQAIRPGWLREKALETVH